MKNVLALFAAIASPLTAAPLSGTKSIGPTGDYASISAAIADVQSQTLSGPIALQLQQDYVPAVETFPITFGNLPTSAANTLTIRPQSGATNLSITSADTTAATVDLNGARFVIFDGRPGGVGAAKELTIANTSIGGLAVRFINEASDNTLRHLTLQGVNTSAASGTVVFSTTTGANGNDNNTIDTCDLRDGATTPANALYSLGTTAQSNSGNAVSNCNVFNFYSDTAVDAAGVRLDGGNTDWSITGNSFYQTISRAAVAANVRAIYLNTHGINFTITGNFIGGTAPGAGGTEWTTTGISETYRFGGIQLAVNTTAASSVQDNTIQNIAFASSSNNTSLPGVWTGIYVSEGNVNIGTVKGNTIGSGTGTGSISVTTSGNGGTSFGIGSASTGTVTIANNTIGSATSSGSDATVSASLVGIQVTAGANTISGNTLGSAATANSLNAATPSTSTTGQQVTGILSTSSNSASITGNTVANLNNNFVGTSTSGQIRGIVTSSGKNSITGNIVRNLSTTSGNPNTTNAASVIGISQSSTVAGQTVSQNGVHSLANTVALGTGGASVFGVYYAGTTTGSNLIARNLVHSLAIPSASKSSVLYGMYFNSGAFTAQNNMVRVGLDASGSSTAGGSGVIGLYDNSATPGRNFYHNSVYVGGMQTSDGQNTYAFRSSGTNNTRDFRNNIFANARSSNSVPKYKHYAVGYGGNGANLVGLTANNNLFFVSGIGGVLGIYNSYPFDRTTLAEWQAATGQDGSSAVGDPLFVNATGDAAAVDLHLQASNPTEGGGTPIAAVTNDFDGQTRNSLTPADIGADAGNFTAIDVIAPAISYPLLADGTAANRTLTGWAGIVDNSGTVASGMNAPRLYYKKATDSDSFLGNTAADNGWKYVTATGGSGTYSFTIDYMLINGGGVSEGDSVQYFVVAQDDSNNLASSPATAGAIANPPVRNINAKPVAGVNSYRIVSTLGGTVTVGPGGTYTNLTGPTGLFAALNSRPLATNLTVNLTGDTTEVGGTVLNAFMPNSTNYPSVPTTFSVRIQSESATMRTISGSAPSDLIVLNGTQRMTIDGSFGGSGRYLRFRNTSTPGATLRFFNDASYNTVRNCVLEGTAGRVVTFSSGLTTGNDNNSVTGNQIRDRSDAVGVPAYLVYSYGTSDTVANSSNTISDNDLFNFTYAGIYVESGSASWTITGNTIYQTSEQGALSRGIYLNGLGTNTIRCNTVRDLMIGGYGIELSTQTGNTTVADNRLWNFGNSPNSASLVIGIHSQHGVGQSVTVVNNMIALSSSGASSQGFYGIRLNGTSGSTTVADHNTVYIAGIGVSGANTWTFYHSGNSTVTAKNNLFLNLRTGGGNHFAARYSTANTGTLMMDCNIYAGTGLSSARSFFDAGTGTPISYAQWQANVPTDVHSSAGNPGGNYTGAMFVDVASGDLHLVSSGNPLVNDTGIPLAGVTTDYDGDMRSLTTPDIGADELRPPFQQWAQANTVGDDPNSPGANGLANLLNFAFGLNPASASRNELSYPGNVITPGGLTTQILSGSPTAKFIRRADYVAAGLTYHAQFSADLSSWETDNTTPTVFASDGMNEVAGLNYPLMPGGVRARFFRLVVDMQ